MFTKFRNMQGKRVEDVDRRLLALKQQWNQQFLPLDTYATYRTREYYKKALIDIQNDIRKTITPKLFFDKEHKNILEEQEIYATEFADDIEQYNKRFTGRRLSAHKSLFDGKDDNSFLSLDEEQRKAVIRDDQHNLVVAAAGSGKTSVLTTRIAYLLKRPDSIPPERILALAFNRDAAAELKIRLKENFSIDNVDVATFHSFGKKILREGAQEIYDVIEKPEQKLREIFTELFSKHSYFQDLLIEFLKNHLQESPEEAGFKTTDEFYHYVENQQYTTLAGIEVRSVAEKEIANFFFTHGIEFKYEKRALWADKYSTKHVSYHPDFYLPQFDIYVEHWGLDRNGNIASWFSMSSEQYRQDREWKLEIFKKAKKRLVESWYYEQKEGTLLQNLKWRLQAIDPTIAFIPLSSQEIIKKIDYSLRDEKSRIFDLVTTFIHHAKSNFLTPSHIEKIIRNGTFGARSLVFGNLAIMVYAAYEKCLAENRLIDFDDMINKAIEVIRKDPAKYKDRYDHILVDEFQDISNQRLALIKCFVNDDSNTKLFCVGDDWQSINRFAGSDVSIFVNFSNYFPYPEVSYLTKNYRSSKTIVAMSTHLISFNNLKLDKKVVTQSDRQDKAHVYKITRYTNELEYAKLQNEYILGQILQILNAGFSPHEILVLSRFNRPLRQLADLISQYKDEQRFAGIRFNTIHTSKGSQATHVFILNLVSGVLGFPSEIKDDVVLELVKKHESREDIFEEERRLFYVALTRSKEYLYLYTHDGAESIFLNEVEDYLHEPMILQ